MHPYLLLAVVAEEETGNVPFLASFFDEFGYAHHKFISSSLLDFCLLKIVTPRIRVEPIYAIDASGGLSAWNEFVYKWTSDSRNIVFLLNSRPCVTPCGGLHMINVENGETKRLTDKYSIEDYALISVHE
jgi:hypothetical protein